MRDASVIRLFLGGANWTHKAACRVDDIVDREELARAGHTVGRERTGLSGHVGDLANPLRRVGSSLACVVQELNLVWVS